MSAPEVSGADFASRPRQRKAPDGLPTIEAIDALPEILSKPQAAWLLQISEAHLHRAAKAGELPCGQMGTTLRFSKSALLRHVRGES
ncbi:helix-turn-helix domain-containing protein [Solicola sp. PLA-1-18]|uniref:helix-turn-helix domain-containing protein n=1 Tax=Solicola sp. PLA-1-18 TaxID=3380532 RepID=UPI003B7EC042